MTFHQISPKFTPQKNVPTGWYKLTRHPVVSYLLLFWSIVAITSVLCILVGLTRFEYPYLTCHLVVQKITFLFSILMVGFYVACIVFLGSEYGWSWEDEIDVAIVGSFSLMIVVQVK